MRAVPLIALSLLAAACVSGDTSSLSSSPDADRADRLRAAMADPEAARLFAGVLDSIAPEDGWARTRYLAFDRISGAGVKRTHRWDLWDGSYWLRADVPDGEMIARFNVNTPTAAPEIRIDGEPVTDSERAVAFALQAYRMFINDTYWLVFPFKWNDPGVTTRYLGKMELWGETFEAIELSFDAVGLTPQNRYRAFVDPDSGMFEIWQYYGNAEDDTPGFTQRWTDWQRHGPILLSSRREGEDGSVGVRFENLVASDQVPPGAFLAP